MRRDRHSARAVCKNLSMYGLIVALAALAQPAEAQELRIALDDEAPAAPAMVTVSAELGVEEAIISYAWTGLADHPQCRGPSCVMSIPVATCTRVELEVVPEFSPTMTATRAVCALDDLGGMPPRVDFALDDTHPDHLAITLVAAEGSDPIQFYRAWVDGREVVEDPRNLQLMRDRGCHAVAALVGDGSGRAGIAEDTICFDDVAPRVWITAQPAQGSVDDTFTLCADDSHPTALEVTYSALGDLRARGCGFARPRPAEVHVFNATVEDSDGVRSTGSALLYSHPRQGRPLLFFAGELEMAPAVSEEPFWVELSLWGGEPPYIVEAGVEGEVLSVASEARDHLRLETEKLLVGVGPAEVFVKVTDSRGMVASVSSEVAVAVGSGGGPVVAAQADSGCSARLVAGGPRSFGQVALPMLIAALALFLRARPPQRRGRR